MSARYDMESYGSYKNNRNYSSYESYYSNRKNGGNSDNNRNKRISVILAVMLVIAAGAFMMLTYRSIQRGKVIPAAVQSEPVSIAEQSEPAVAEEQSKSMPASEPTVSPEELKTREEAERARVEALKAEASQYSFYQKLEKGYGTNILVLGDASAMDGEGDRVNGIVDGPRFRGLSEYLNEKYPSKTSEKTCITNLAYEKGSLLGDAIRIKNLPAEPSYDLVILSYGINENKIDIVSDYEALLLVLKNKYPDCSIICTLEPCFHSFSSELEMMDNICKSCEIPVINLYSWLYGYGSEKYYDFFDADQTFLNDRGTEEWIKLICEVIDKNVSESSGKMKDMPLIETKAAEIAKLELLPVSDPCLSRRDDTSYVLNIKTNGLAYFQHRNMLRENDVKIIADDILYGLIKSAGAETPAGGFIIPIHDQLVSENSMEIVFANKELADGLEGLYLIKNAQ